MHPETLYELAKQRIEELRRDAAHYRKAARRSQPFSARTTFRRPLGRSAAGLLVVIASIILILD